jgi:hypothetical protein
VIVEYGQGIGVKCQEYILYMAIIYPRNLLYCVVNKLYEDLEIEIEFWRVLIDQSDLSSSSPELVRMQQAMQLARRKLSDCEQYILQPMANLFTH